MNNFSILLTLTGNINLMAVYAYSRFPRKKIEKCLNELWERFNEYSVIYIDDIKFFFQNPMIENRRAHNYTPTSSHYSTGPPDGDLQRLDPARVLQIHRSLVQSRDPSWTNHRDVHTVSIILWCLCIFFLELGPQLDNTEVLVKGDMCPFCFYLYTCVCIELYS